MSSRNDEEGHPGLSHIPCNNNHSTAQQAAHDFKNLIFNSIHVAIAVRV